jgi:hypothetical protein
LVTEVGGTGDEKYRPRYEGNVKTDFEWTCSEDVDWFCSA